MMNKTEDALATFSNGFNCAQAVLSAFSADFGLKRETALRIASGLGAGLGHQGSVCGAVLGACVVLGLMSGSSLPNDALSKETVYGLTRKFASDFTSIHHSLICRELLNTDLSTPDGFNAAVENQLFEKLCPVFVKDAVIILEDLIKKSE